MKNLKHFLILALLILFSIYATENLDSNANFIKYTSLLILIYFVLVFGLRTNIKMKSFFTSPLNVFTSKIKLSSDYTVAQELLFEKTEEVLRENGFDKIRKDTDTFLLLVTTPITMKSWGENIYITVEKTDENESRLIYESVAFQMHSWGKNEDNGSQFLSQMEESFII